MVDVVPFKWRKLHDDSSDHSNGSANHIFQTHFIGVRWNGRAGEIDFSCLGIDINIKRPSIEHLKFDKVNMKWMWIRKSIDELPNFGCTQNRFFCDRVLPTLPVQ